MDAEVVCWGVICGELERCRLCMLCGVSTWDAHLYLIQFVHPNLFFNYHVTFMLEGTYSIFDFTVIFQRNVFILLTEDTRKSRFSSGLVFSKLTEFSKQPKYF